MSTERELAEKFKEAVEAKNIDNIYPYLADDMTYEVLPSTVGRKMDKAGWRGEMTGMLAAVESAKLELTNVIEHPLFIVVQANITFAFPSGPFTQEILLLFNFTKDGSGALKIASVTEYVDSFKVKEFKAKMASGAPPPK